MTSATPRRVAVAGAGGRMGHMLIEAVCASDDCVLAGALDVAASPSIGQDAAAFLGRASGVAVTADLRAGLAGADVLIDFTRPEGTLAHAALCAELGVQMVIGTTGFSEAQKAELAAAARKVAIVLAPNMSVGVNVTLKLLEMAARALADGYDIEIIEAHHKHKVDAPSGTAYLLGREAAKGRGVDLKDKAVKVRDGITGPREEGTIGFATVRGGGVIGDHSVMFASDNEMITLSHRATDRSLFASGALKSALWARDKKPGLYSTLDVLGLSAD